MAKNNKNQNTQAASVASTVLFKKCDLFNKTFEKYKKNAQVVAAFKEFIEAKTKAPTEPFRSKDYRFTNRGFYAGMSHTALTFDISLVYKLEGSATKTIYLYGIFSHDELGTGQPANIKKQQQVGSKISNQEF